MLLRYKDGRELVNNMRINITHANNGASTFYISHASADDSGIYQVTASNDFGIAVYHTEIEVERECFVSFFFFKLKL
jgi:hypothetical protein